MLYIEFLSFPDSSAVEHLAVNEGVPGSNPGLGAQASPRYAKQVVISRQTAQKEKDEKFTRPQFARSSKRRRESCPRSHRKTLIKAFFVYNKSYPQK
jgi:hypothetical protein